MATPTRTFSARLRYATIRTTNLDEAVRFYEQVLGFPRTKTSDDFVQLDAGGAELCVDRDDGGDIQPQLIFAVDDLQAAYDSVRRAGIEIVAGDPESPYFIVRDPDGNEVVLEK
jgi:catechol 2,3-dioxygenase-like lactoylglutathione lyase family enzyme